MNHISLNNKDSWKIGFTGCYIQDYPFSFLCEIPVEAAVEWVKRICSDKNMGHGILAKDLRITNVGNGWLNKLFILVDCPHGKWIALVKWDYTFSIYIER